MIPLVVALVIASISYCAFKCTRCKAGTLNEESYLSKNYQVPTQANTPVLTLQDMDDSDENTARNAIPVPCPVEDEVRVLSPLPRITVTKRKVKLGEALEKIAEVLEGLDMSSTSDMGILNEIAVGKRHGEERDIKAVEQK